jgi:hypothetical protein
MDPIHPITPRPPALAPIAPAPSDRTARDRREQRRRGVDRDPRGRGRAREDIPTTGQVAELQQREPPTGGPGKESDPPYPGEDDGPRHIDVRA